ncbi:uncharacterized protein MONBRDRAFT_39300 [Monosiga brevicollis MX1]|uniref:Large ribosomal subunit protein bL21m n=2 Tax=Monosiga brevicollis TaxID=81824 RepID=A9VDL2_MONBE|nr:uncharacterized protein MONBRDRAFT_39300 [Monosiga brevicollis MX1]EDQ84414.1 predicted protein [Monosiga brevicollis MX1]|eukprot:XP_001750815.1 hypothetical protein [Monosiga brevicollis MX1]
MWRRAVSLVTPALRLPTQGAGLAPVTALRQALTRQPMGVRTAVTQPKLELTSEQTVAEAVTRDLKRGNPFFAVVQVAGKQYKVSADDVITTHRLDAELGALIRLEKVLLSGGPSFSLIGQPLLRTDVVTVLAEVTEHVQGAKIVAFKKKRRQGYARKKGHRQPLTRLRIRGVQIDAQSLEAQGAQKFA